MKHLIFLALAFGLLVSGCTQKVNMGPHGSEVGGAPVCEYQVDGTGTADISVIDGYGNWVDLGKQTLPYRGGGPFIIGHEIGINTGNVALPNVTRMAIVEMGTVLISSPGSGMILAWVLE